MVRHICYNLQTWFDLKSHSMLCRGWFLWCTQQYFPTDSIYQPTSTTLYYFPSHFQFCDLSCLISVCERERGGISSGAAAFDSLVNNLRAFR